MNAEKKADGFKRAARRAALIAAGRTAMREYIMQKYLTYKEKYETYGRTEK